MLATFLQYLHVLPFAVIIFAVTLMVSNKNIASKLNADFVMAFLLALASVGLAAGHFIHENGIMHLELFDPCYGYVATILCVALRILKGRTASENI